MRKKLKKIINNIFQKKQKNLNQTSSTLLNFIIKTKREKSLKEKINITPCKNFKKVDRLFKKISFD